MIATDFEFKNRFWIIFAIFAAAYCTAFVDPVGAAEALKRPALVLWLATGLAAIGAAFRTWGAAYLGVEVVRDAAVHSEALVADGPYRYTRNPLYFGLLLVGVAYGFTASRIGWVVLVAGMWLFLKRLIGREERAMVSAQGESFAKFRAAVPQLFPALRPALPAKGTAPRWPAAFLGEILQWGLVAALAVFAATLDRTLFQYAAIAAVVAYAVTHLGWKLFFHG